MKNLCVVLDYKIYVKFEIIEGNLRIYHTERTILFILVKASRSDSRVVVDLHWQKLVEDDIFCIQLVYARDFIRTYRVCFPYL